MEWVASIFDSAQQWVFESVMQPLLFAMGFRGILESGYDAAVGCWWEYCKLP